VPVKARCLIVSIFFLTCMSCSEAQNGSLESRFVKTKESMKRQLADATIPATRRAKLTAVDAALARLGTSADLQGTSVPVYAAALKSNGKVAIDVSWIADVASVDRLRLVQDGKVIAELTVPDVYINENKRISSSVVCFDASAFIDEHSVELLLQSGGKDTKWSVELFGPATDKQTQSRSIPLDVALLATRGGIPPPSPK